MKCDELKDYDYDPNFPFQSRGRFYNADEVETAIAELKAENERLKKCEIWMKQHFYCEEVIACESAKNRRLKRALWLARAYFCARSCEYFNGIMSHCLIGQNDLYNRCEKKKNKYLNAMYKCRAKAEEYK